MNKFTQYAAALTLGLAAGVTIAAPSKLITHNLTDVESNAFIAGAIPSPIPTKANTTNSVSWFIVKMACYGHTVDNKCPAMIKMATDTANPVELGMVYMDMDTGEITPAKLSANGYTLTVNGIAESTLSKD